MTNTEIPTDKKKCDLVFESLDNALTLDVKDNSDDDEPYPFYVPYSSKLRHEKSKQNGKEVFTIVTSARMASVRITG